MIEVDSSGDEDVLGEEAENPDGMKCARSGLETMLYLIIFEYSAELFN